MADDLRDGSVDAWADPDGSRRETAEAAVDRAPDPVVRRVKLLRPRLGAGVVARPRLVDRLNASLEVPVTLVVGPAGFGKTTLLCQWLAACPCSSAWLSLDEEDDDLATFVAHFLAALRTAVPDAGEETLALLRLPRRSSPATLGATLCDELIDLDDNVVLVLDDYQAIADAAIHEFLAALLRHPAPPMHLVLSARHDPALPLAVMRARGRVAEVRAADLRFTDGEARAFLERATTAPLDGETSRILQARIEGWAAGWRFAELALRGDAGAEGLVQAFATHGRRHVMDFLLDEVLSRQPVAVRAFMLRTSIVERVSASLADALLDAPLGLGGSQALLEGLARADLFVVPLGEEGGWFRYHHLFRELLRHQLRLEVGPAGEAELQARASAWHEDRGLIEPAIRHALAAGAPDQAAALVERHAMPALEADECRTPGRWLALLPLARWARSDRDAAIDGLSEALRHAEPGGLIRVFVHLEPRMAELFGKLPPLAGPPPDRGRLPSALAEVPAVGAVGLPSAIPHGRPPQDPIPEQLTEREHEILERLSRRHSNKEIADELFISPLTVKRHASNIYGKLGVHSRRQAIRRASALGWIASP
jgi:ATP/maltotriose-dependent transcriptional regulator MalT